MKRMQPIWLHFHVSKCHTYVPSMFAASLVIVDGVRVKAAMLPCYLRHFRLQVMVGNFAATFRCLSWVRSIKLLRRSS